MDYYDKVIEFALKQGYEKSYMFRTDRRKIQWNPTLEMSYFVLSMLTQRYHDITQLAKRLGISRPMVYNRLSVHEDKLEMDNEYKERYIALYLEFMKSGGNSVKSLAMMLKIVELSLLVNKGKTINDSFVKDIINQLKNLI